MNCAGPAPAALAAWHRLLRAWGEPAWLVCAARFEVIAISAEAVALLGRPEAELLGQPAEAMIAAPEDLAYWQEARRSEERRVGKECA